MALTDVPSRTSDVSSTCEVAFWQIVSSTNDETSSATYGSGAAHATVEISLMSAVPLGIKTLLLGNVPLK